jgi:hypothetical protein
MWCLFNIDHRCASALAHHFFDHGEKAAIEAGAK